MPSASSSNSGASHRKDRTHTDNDVNPSASAAIAVAGPSAATKKSLNFFKWVAAAVTLISGVMSVMSTKLQSLYERPINAAGDLKSYEQPFWQTAIMFCGEAMCVLVWLYDERVVKKGWGRRCGIFEFADAETLAKRETPIWWWICPTLLDLTGSTCVNVAFAMTYGSTVQMLRNSMLIITSCSSLILLKRPLRVHEWLGIIIMTAGMIAAGIMAVVNPDDNAVIDSSKSWIGIVLTLGGTVFSAVQLTIEEKFYEKTYTAPMKAVAIEGFSGMFFSVIFIVVCHFAGFYNFADGWYQMNHSSLIIGCNIWYLFSVFAFNGAGLITTFLGNALLRGVIFSCRAPIVFLIELAARLQAFTWGGFASLILTTIGFLVYSYIIPFVGRRRTPKTHQMMRKGVPCFCTHELPESDIEAATEDTAHQETAKDGVEIETQQI